MPGRAALAVLLLAAVFLVAIRCVPGRLGVVNVGAVIPPMPLKTTPEGFDDAPARPTFTATPSATRTPTPTPASPTPGPGEPEPLPEFPLVPDRPPIR